MKRNSASMSRHIPLVVVVGHAAPGDGFLSEVSWWVSMNSSPHSFAKRELVLGMATGKRVRPLSAGVCFSSPVGAVIWLTAFDFL